MRLIGSLLILVGILSFVFGMVVFGNQRCICFLLAAASILSGIGFHMIFFKFREYGF